MNQKICSKCKESKSVSEFGKASKEKSGLKSRCKACVSIDGKDYRLNNSEKRKETTRNYHLRNSENINKRSREWYAANKEKARETRSRWRTANYEKDYADRIKYREENAEKLKAAAKIWSDKNRDKVNRKARKWRENNPEKVSAANRLWSRTNRQKAAAKSSRRIAAKLKATPLWANHFFIEEIYDLAKLRTDNTGIAWHVDHIVPIRSKLVCGLHCHNNLRVIPAKINLLKSNMH